MIFLNALIWVLDFLTFYRPVQLQGTLDRSIRCELVGLYLKEKAPKYYVLIFFLAWVGFDARKFFLSDFKLFLKCEISCRSF